MPPRRFYLRDADFECVPMDESVGLGESAIYIRPHSVNADGAIRLTVDDFASAIAAMTPKGDTGETWSAAKHFLLTGKFE